MMPFPQPLTPEQMDQILEQQRQMQKFAEWELTIQKEVIRDLYRFTAVTCGCRSWFRWPDRNEGTSAPQIICSIHGSLPNILIYLELE